MSIAPFSGISEPLQIKTVVVVVGDGSAPITPGLKAYVECAFPGTISSWRLLGSPAGSAVVDIWKANAAIPTVANTITAGGKPTLTSAQRAVSAVPGTWTRRIDVNDVLAFNVDSVSTLTQLTILLDIQV